MAAQKVSAVVVLLVPKVKVMVVTGILGYALMIIDVTTPYVPM
jgi:hypothetical protein